MSAYLILSFDVLDESGLAEYRKTAAPVLLAPGAGTIIAADSQTVDLHEGDAVAGTHTVVIAFDDVEQAREVYASEAYRGPLETRLSATVPRTAVIVAGTPS